MREKSKSIERVTAHFRRGVGGTFVRSYRRLRHRPGSMVRLGDRGVEAGNIAYLYNAEPDVIYIEPNDVFDEEGRVSALKHPTYLTRVPIEDVLAHESLHQALDRNVGSATSGALDRLSLKYGAPIGTRFSKYTAASKLHLSQPPHVRDLTERQAGHSIAAERKEFRARMETNAKRQKYMRAPYVRRKD